MRASSLATARRQTSFVFRLRGSARGWQLPARELRLLFRQPRCAWSAVHPVPKATSRSPSRCCLCREESAAHRRYQVLGLRAVGPAGTWLWPHRSLYARLRAHHCAPVRTSPPRRQSCRLSDRGNAMTQKSESKRHLRSPTKEEPEREPPSFDRRKLSGQTRQRADVVGDGV